MDKARALFFSILILAAACAVCANQHEQNVLRKKTCEVTHIVESLGPGQLTCYVTNDQVTSLRTQSRDESVRSVETETSCVHVTPENCTRAMHCSTAGLWTLDDFQCPGGGTAIDRAKRLDPVTVGVIVVAGVIGVGAVLCWLFCPKKSRCDGNSGPSITCPPDPATVTAGKNQRKAVVKWAEPKTDDDGHGGGELTVTMSPPSPTSGNSFTPGTHPYNYHVTDGCGSSAQCSIDITVKVVYCPEALTPAHGKKDCTYTREQRPVYGNTCRFTCNAGFTASSDSVVDQQCELNGQWTSGGSVTCDRISCGEPLLPGHGVRGQCSNGFLFESSCSFKCEDGFDFPENAAYFTKCTATGDWSTVVPDCVDVEAPVISDCPVNIVAFTDRGLTSAVVLWTLPTAFDNLDGAIPVFQSAGLSNGSAFEAGDPIDVEYEATDAAGNKATPCKFTVTVQDTLCPVPPTSARLDVVCEDRLTYGAQCLFSCQDGFPLVGPNSAFCERDPESPATGYWDWGNNSTAPYCRVIPCTDLDPPDHGALACGAWSLGQYCQMQCNDQYDLPRGVTTNGDWVCDTTKGVWRPDDFVPDCSAQRRPGRIGLPSEMFYFSGSCANETTMDEIRNQFIAHLNQSRFSSICTESDECHTDNVKVTCGAERRRKRDTNGGYRYIMSWDFVMNTDFSSDASSATELWEHHENVLYAMVNIVQENARSGQFNITRVPGVSLTVDAESLRTGLSDIVCAEGEEVRESFTCAPCPTGTHYSRSSDSCEPCPVGSYAETPGMFACTPCPDGTSTLTIRSKNLTQCLDICAAGWWSSTGLERCVECPAGSHQPDSGQTHCTQCPVSTTSSPANTLLSNCKAYELYLERLKQVTVGSVRTNTSLTLTFWAVLDVAASTSSRVLVQVLTSRTALTVSYGARVSASLVVSNVTTEVESAMDVADDNWHYVAVTWDAAWCALSLTVDGVVTWKYSLPSVCSLYQSYHLGSVVDEVVAGSKYNQGPTRLSMLSVWPSNVTSSDVPTNCSVDDTSAAWRWRLVQHMSLPDGVHLSYPSTCGDGNDCEPDPCNGHPCVDKIHGYQCRCQDDYTGRNCDIEPDPCAGAVCGNEAACSKSPGGYTCHCVTGYTGVYCETEIVDGGWSEWGPPTECSKSCGGGVQSSQRHCNDPPPSGGGQECSGHDTQTLPCEEQPCPECSPLENQRQYKQDISCDTTSDGLVCNVTCREVLVLTPPFVTTCGSSTGYVWSHQLTNPNATLPPCTKSRVPKQMVLRSSASIEGVDCDADFDDVINSVTGAYDDVTNQAGCVQEGKCSQSVSVEGCDVHQTGRRRRRATQTITVTNTISANLSQTEEYFVDGVFDNSSALDVVTEWYNVLVDLENVGSVLQDSIDRGLVQFTLGGVLYNLTAENFIQNGVIGCPDGMASANAVCVNCGAGEYETDGDCLACPRGTYQEEEGRTSCELCPNLTTTDYEGAHTPALCTVPSDQSMNDTTIVTNELTSSTAVPIESTSEDPRDGSTEDARSQTVTVTSSTAAPTMSTTNRPEQTSLWIIITPVLIGGAVLVAMAIAVMWKLKKSSQSQSKAFFGSRRLSSVSPQPFDVTNQCRPASASNVPLIVDGKSSRRPSVITSFGPGDTQLPPRREMLKSGTMAGVD